MKKIFYIFLFLSVVATFILSLNGCIRENQEVDTSVAADNALAEKIFADVKSISDQAANGSLQTFVPDVNDGFLSGCVTITHDTTISPRKLTINFGTTNCICNDGSNRRGKIMVTYTGKYRDVGTVIHIGFDGYYVNDNQIMNSSSKTITNNGTNTSGHLTYTVNVTALITTWDNKTLSWASTRTNEWIAGESTFLWNDDEYLITGTASGIGTKGYPWTIAITKAVHLKVNCKWITEGTVEISPTGKSKLILDYGNGGCDSQASVTVNGKIYHITL